MRASFLCFAVMFLVSHVDAASAPEPGKKAKEELKTLKKKLPDIVNSWAKERWSHFKTVEFRVVRMLGPTQAKVVVMALAVDDKGVPYPKHDEVFTIFLDFYDGAWSTTRFDATWPETNDYKNKDIRFLMLAIEEASERKATEE